MSGKAFKMAGGTSGFDTFSPCRRSLRNELEKAHCREEAGVEKKKPAGVHGVCLCWLSASAVSFVPCTTYCIMWLELLQKKATLSNF